MRVPTNKLQQMAIYTTLLTGAGCGTMYYLMQKNFSRSDYHSLALEKLKANQSAMDSLGAPPLKVHNVHLSDRYNRVEPCTAQIKIPVTGSKDGGYLYTTSVRDPQTLGWNLTQAVLQLREGQSIDLTSTSTDKKEGLDTDNWSL